jgi:tagatose-1,6-bisphosphate aldolase
MLAAHADPTHPPREETHMGEPASQGLDAIARDDGTLAIVAMDQRNTLRRMLTTAEKATDAGTMQQFKRDVVTPLFGLASGVLLDPELGVPAIEGVDRRGCGVLVAAEPEKRATFQAEPRATRLESQNAAWVRGLGGDAVKYLVQLRADRPTPADGPDLVAELVDVVRAVVEDCRSSGMPAVIENLIYRLPDEDELSPERRADAIIEAAHLLDGLGCDLLKLEYPGSPEACRRLADTISTPWAVLSAGVAFERFTEVLEISCDEGGASGFIAGRAIWKEAVELEGQERRRFLDITGRARLEACIEAIEGRARPWREAD